MEGVWGQLYPHSGTFPRLALNQEIFRLGRAKTSGYVIRESDMGGSKWLNAVSKCQCEIVMHSTGVGTATRWARKICDPSSTTQRSVS